MLVLGNVLRLITECGLVWLGHSVWNREIGGSSPPTLITQDIIGKKNGNKTDFCLKYNKELYNRINGYIYNKHWQNIELKDFKLKFDMNNDERKNITITSFSSYINGKAYPFEYKVALKERDNIVIEVSEIFSKCISEMDNNMVYPVFSIEL